MYNVENLVLGDYVQETQFLLFLLRLGKAPVVGGMGSLS
jgi:hypothetical protein